MRKRMKVILDADDVLFNCNEEAVKDLNEELGTDYKKSQISKWGILGNGLDRRLKFFKDPDWIRSLPLMEGATDFVSQLAEFAEILVVTNVEPRCAGARMDAIIRAFPEINPSNILIGGRKDLLKADIMLDDRPENLEYASGVEYPVLFRQPWNYEKTGLYSVSTYEEFLTLAKMVQSGMGLCNPKDYDSIVLVGPSGSGKKYLADRLTERNRRIIRILSYTTKKDGIGYTHVSEEKFHSLAENGVFFETSSYMGHLFGTREEDLQKVMEDGGIPLLIMDINGMIAMKSIYHPLAVYVTGSREECIRNILLRSIPTDEKVQRIAAIDLESRNEQFCDITLTAGYNGSL